MTTATDDFNRANGAIGGNWTTGIGGAPDVTSNQLTCGGTSEHITYRTAESFGDDQYSQIEVRTHGDFSGVTLRGASNNLYLAGASSNTVFGFSKVTAGGFTNLDGWASNPWITGGIMKAEAIGSLLRCYQNGFLVGSTHDTTFTTGSPGLRLWNVSTVFDNWAGGDGVALPTTGLVLLEQRNPPGFPNTTSQSYSNVHFGAAASDREILVFVHGLPSGGAFTFTCDVAGVTATEVATQLAGNNHRTSLFRAAVPTGTTGTISITSSANSFASNITVYAAYGLGTLLDSAGGATTGTGAISLDVDVAAGGKVLGCVAAAGIGGTAIATWTGLTKLVESQMMGSAWWVSSAALEPVAGSTPLTVSVSNSSGSSGYAALVVSFNATGPTAYTLDADSAAYAWSATASGLDVGMPSDSAAYVWAPSDATLQYGALVSYVLNADTHAYLWNASEASLEYSGAFHGGGAGSGGQARSRAGGFWRAGKFIPYEDVAPPDIKSPGPALLSELEPAPDNTPIVRSDTKQRSVVGPGSFADIGRTSPKVKVPPNLTRPKPGRSDTRKNAPPILGEVKALTPPSLEDRVAKAIEAGMAKALTARAEADKPSAEELAQAEEDRELKLLKQLGFLAND